MLQNKQVLKEDAVGMLQDVCSDGIPQPSIYHIFIKEQILKETNNTSMTTIKGE